jgi:peptidoglycan LD-endopeptidase LytH
VTRRRRPLRAGIVAVGIVGVVTLTSCGGDGTGATTTSTTDPPSTTTSTTVGTTTTTTTTSTTSTTTTTTTTSTTTTTTLPDPVYVFPVQPPEAADYGSVHHDYPATDIFAPIGTSVVAVTSGVVDEVSRVDPWDPSVDDPATRSGLYVSIVGDDGVRYYSSHLDTVADGLDAGDRVTAGQVVGTVGKTGNAASTPSHVHFGLSRPTFPGDWEVRRGQVSPYPYLQAWEQGIAMTPDLE